MAALTTLKRRVTHLFARISAQSGNPFGDDYLVRMRAKPNNPRMLQRPTGNTMSKITIEKFIDGKYDTSFSVPGFALDFLTHLLPRSALGEAIVQAQKAGIPYESSSEVEEDGVRKTVVIKVG